MLPEMEMLQYIYKTADMGVSGIDSVLSRMDPSPLQKTLESQRSEYLDISRKARHMIESRGEEAQGAGLMARTSADWMTAGKMAMDDSPSKIAEMTIQGTTMGITKTLKHLHDSPEQGETTQLGNRLLRLQERNLEEMKKYL